MLGITQQQARVLLIYYRWDVEKLLSAFGDDEEACFRKAGISSSSAAAAPRTGETPSQNQNGYGVTWTCPAAQPRSWPPPATSHPLYILYASLRADGEVSCQICLSDVPSEEAVASTNCGHLFCKSCWRGHLNTLARAFQTALSFLPVYPPPRPGPLPPHPP